MASDATVVDVSSDWLAACDVQQRFMRHPGVQSLTAVGALSYRASCRQVRALGGDCYDFLPLPENRLAFAVADASGKGLPAAMMISNVQSSLRTAASFADGNATCVLGAVNRQVYSSSLADRYATLFYGVFDAATHTLRYANAGHNPPLVLRRDSSVVRLEAGGVPLGIFPNSSYAEGSIRLNSGDVVIAYTDGVTEATNPAGREWGIDGLRSAALECQADCADDFVRSIFASLDEFSQGRQSDDATLLVIRVL